MTAQVFHFASRPHRGKAKKNSTNQFLATTEPQSRIDVEGYTFVGATGEWMIDRTIFGISYADGAGSSYWWVFGGVDPVEVRSPEGAIALLKARNLLRDPEPPGAAS